MKRIIFAIILLLGTVPLHAQWREKTDSAKVAETRAKIGLELDGVDYDTHVMSARVMGEHLTDILDYLLDHYGQASYNKRLCRIIREQNPALENTQFEIKKLKFKKASKRGSELSIVMQATLDKNPAKVKQTDVAFHFQEGVSGSEAVNEFFTILSHYVRMRKELQP